MQQTLVDRIHKGYCILAITRYKHQHHTTSITKIQAPTPPVRPQAPAPIWGDMGALATPPDWALFKQP